MVVVSVLERAIAALLRFNVSSASERYLELEQQVSQRVEPPYALRLDGVGFGQALKGYREPRDPVVHAAIVSAATHLVRKFQGVGAWVSSDEINLVVLGPENPYGGRVEKLVSVSAGLASSIVTSALNRVLFFDSRVVPLESAHDAARYIIYRARVAASNFVTKLLQIRGVEPKGGFGERLNAARPLLSLYGDWALLGTSVVWKWFVRRGKPRRRVVALLGPEPLATALGLHVT